MRKKRLTQEYLKSILLYDPMDGIFIWIVRKCGVRYGSIAGGFEKNGYNQIEINRVKYYSHRLAFFYMTGEFPKWQVDHINHDRSDNRWCNLRLCSRSENMVNMKKFKNNRSGFTGVHFDRREKRWRSYISDKGNVIHLGYFDSKDRAIEARKEAEDKYNFHSNHGK